MPSVYLFIAGTALLSLNFVRFAGLAVSDWFYFGAMFLALVETARFDRENFHCWTRNRFAWLAGLILLGAIISTSHSLSINAAIMEIFQQLYVVTLFISLIWIMVRRGKTDVVVQAFIWSGVFTAGIATIDYMAGTNFGPRLSGTPNIQFWGRYASSLGHPNKLGYFLVLTSILSVARLVEVMLKRSPLTTRVLWGVLLFIQVLGVYLSGSLTAYLGFLLGMFVLLISSGPLVRRISRYMVPALLFGVSVLLFGMIFANVSLPNTLSFENSLISTALNRVETLTAYSRWYIFQAAFESIGENPIVGAGYDQISTSGIAMDFRQLNGTVHNMFLQNWYVGGLFAFLGWLVIYAWLAWMAIRLARSADRRTVTPLLVGIAAATLAMILMDQFQDAVYQREKWLVAGLLAAHYWTRMKTDSVTDSRTKRTVSAPVLPAPHARFESTRNAVLGAGFTRHSPPSAPRGGVSR